MTGCPMSGDNLSAMSLDTTSSWPPAGNGTTRRIGFCGHAGWASATSARSAKGNSKGTTNRKGLVPISATGAKSLNGS